MAKKKRTYNTNLIKARHSYTILEIAELFDIHRRTVQSWLKQGLQVIDASTKPYLIVGEELKRFLKKRAQKRKHPLKDNEFFCTSCHCPRKSHPLLFTIEISNKKLGKKYKQALIKGVCEVCGQSLTRFSSDRQVAELKKKAVLVSEQVMKLGSNEDSIVNTDIEGGENEKAKYKK